MSDVLHFAVSLDRGFLCQGMEGLAAALLWESQTLEHHNVDLFYSRTTLTIASKFVPCSSAALQLSAGVKMSQIGQREVPKQHKAHRHMLMLDLQTVWPERLPSTPVELTRLLSVCMLNVHSMPSYADVRFAESAT